MTNEFTAHPTNTISEFAGRDDTFILSEMRGFASRAGEIKIKIKVKQVNVVDLN